MGSESDDIDAGWDDAPESAAAASSTLASQAPEAAAPPGPEATPLASGRPSAYTSSESLNPAVVSTPPPSVERSPLTRIGPIAALAALAAASIVWLGRAPASDPPRAVAAARPASERVALPAELAAQALQVAAPSRPPPPPPPVAVARASATDERLEMEPLVLEPPTKVGVTLRSVPDGAIFFEAGQRLGAGTIHINVVHDVKRHLTALLNGYQPLNFKVDGTSDAVTVRLTPVGAEPAAPAAGTPDPAAATP